MTTQEILEKAKHNKEELKTKYHEENEDLAFIETFLKNNDINTLDGICALKLSNYLIAFIKANNPDVPLEEIKENVYSNVLIIESLNSSAFFYVIKFLTAILDSNKREELQYILQSKDKKAKKDLLETLAKEKFEVEEQTLSIMEKIADAKDEPIKVLDLMAQADNEIIEALYSICRIKVLREDRADYLDEINNLVLQWKIEINDNEKKKKVNEYIYRNYSKDIERIKNDGNIISKYYQKLQSSEKSKKKEQRKAMQAYDNFMTEFPKALQRDEIIEYEKLINKMTDKNLRLEILKQIYLHNQRYYESLEKRRDELLENSLINYQLLLQEYGIEKGTYNVELITKNSVADTKYILNKLSKMDIKDPESIIHILTTSNKSIVDQINFLREKGILQNIFIGQHNNLFDENNNEYRALSANLDYLNENKINPFYFEQSQDVLLLEKEKFSKSIKTLKDYKLLANMNKNVKYDFLVSDNLESRIDSILELGYEKNVEENLNLLNHDEKKWQRIRVLNELNQPVESTEDLEKVLSVSNFFIPDSKLSDYIYNAVPDVLSIKINNLNSLPIQEDETNLNDYNHTNRTYKIGDVIISKNKVARNLEKLKDIPMEQEERLLVSVVSGSTLNEEEYKSIRKALNPKLTL